MEKYLKEGERSRWEILLKLRANASDLRITTGRWEKEHQERKDRICRMCEAHEIEDEMHFLCHCVRFEKERKSLFQKIAEAGGEEFKQMSQTNQFHAILAARHEKVEVRKAIMDGVHKMYMSRIKEGKLIGN